MAISEPEHTLRHSLWAKTLSPEELDQVCAESHELRVNAGTLHWPS